MAKNAIVHNQWLAQFVNPGDLSSFLDKPPLGIWMLAWIPQIVGINELTIHIPNVLYYCLILALLYFFLPRRIALTSTLIAATSLCLVVYSRTPKLDILLTLFVLIAHLALYAFLKKDRPQYLYIFSLALGGGFLVKSGFGIILPGLTVLSLLLFNARARRKLLQILITRYALLSILIFVSLVGSLLYSQSFALKEQWVPFLKSITIQSKYNVGYLGLGFNYSIIVLLLITIFPWTPLFLSNPKIRFRSLFAAHCSLSTFCSFWFWSNFLFLLFFYRQTDLRTFTAFVPPMAILAGMKLTSIQLIPKKCIAEILWGLFFLLIFGAILISLLIRPYNPEGFSLSAAILPISLFVISLFILTTYYLTTKPPLLIYSFLIICTAYSVLFYNTLPIANAFNLDIKWPAIIKQHQAQGQKFYIYRPPDRNLTMSPDLFYVDFIAGPANRYFWDGAELTKALSKDKAIVLSDTQSWEKLKLKGKVLAKDNYSQIVKVN